eukprot:16056788-Heterocapsa_arctica.AAC.1
MRPGPGRPASSASTIWLAQSQARRSQGFLIIRGFTANSAFANSSSPIMRKRSRAASSVASGWTASSG